MPVYGVERPRQLGFQGVYRIAPGGGAPQLLVNRYMFDQPNGLCFSPDERLLYVNDTVQANIRVFDVKGDGTLGVRPHLRERAQIRPRAGRARRHEMRCARATSGSRGRAACGCSRRAGELLGKVRIPELPANLHWGGPDFRTLFVTATHSVYAVEDQGRPAPRAVHARARRDAARRARRRATAGAASPAPGEPLRLDPARCALIIQDMQNDVVMEGGAFASSGAPAHCRAQNAIENARRLADACRARGVMVIHVWFVVEPGAPGVALNAPLFKGLVEGNALVRGSWGAAPVTGLERQAGDYVVEKMRMSAWEGTSLETILKSGAARHHHRHRRLDQHVDRAHGAHRRRQGLRHAGRRRMPAPP